jgi:hypothetical protein
MNGPIIETLLTISVRCGEQEGPIKNGIRKVNDETAREEIPHDDELLLWYSQVLKHEEITSRMMSLENDEREEGCDP